MKKLDRFILRAFLGPFVAILLVVTFILMMQFLWLYIDELVGKGLGIKVILEFLGWGCATLLPLALPLSTLLASMMTMGSLGENNELLAIKAAGISLQRVLAPLIIASAIISVGAFYAGNNLLPLAYNKIYTLRDDILRTKEEIKIPTGTFYDGIEGYILRVDERDDESGIMHGVMVYNHSANKGNISLTIADSAKMTMSSDKSYLTFALYEGSNYEETNTRRYRDTTLQLQQIDFHSQEMIIPLENYAFQKSDEARFGDEVKAMRLDQLRYQKDSIGNLNNDMLTDHINSWTKSRTLRYNGQLDTAIHRNASTDFAPEELLCWKNLSDEIDAYKRAAEAAQDLEMTLSTYTRDTFQFTYILRRIDEGILKKFAQALACFVFFFIGAPIGALIRKGGLGTPAIISVLFFVLYWVVDVSGTKLARDGAVSSLMGVFISTYVLIPIGAFLTWKSINDSALFNTDVIKSQFRKIMRHIMSLFKKTTIVYMGTPDFAVAPLEELIRAGYKISAVVTVPDKPSGRGLKVNESAVKKYAVEHGIPVLQPEKMKDPVFIQQLKDLKADLFVVVAFRMLPKVVWEIPRYGTFNLHAALLPQYRGAAPINWAVINGEAISGVTTFMIDEGIDTGKIMIREQVRISDTDTAGDLHDRLMEIGAKTVVQTVDGILDKNIEYRIQRSFIQGDEQLKPAPKLTKELCHIDWNMTTEAAYNLIRGLSPYPGAYTELVKDGTATTLKIYSASKTTQAALKGEGFSAPAGTVLSDGKTYLAIACPDGGAIAINDLQLAGKKRMETSAFLLGFREPESYSTSKGTSAEFISRLG